MQFGIALTYPYLCIMLQIIVENSDKYSIPELAQMAIEGNCGWIQLHMPDADDSEVREVCAELIPLCKETSTILTLEDRPELARELGIHGVHLTAAAGVSARSVRENLGPEAIIGAEVADAQSIITLKGADIDYVTLPPSLDRTRCAGIIDAATSAGCGIPVVVSAPRNINPQEIAALMADTHAAGVAMSSTVITAEPDPADTVRKIIDTLQKAS